MEDLDFTIDRNESTFQLRVKKRMAENRLKALQPGTAEHFKTVELLHALNNELEAIGEQRSRKLETRIDLAEQLDKAITEGERALQRRASMLQLAQRLYAGQLHKQPGPEAAADKAIELADVFFQRWDHYHTHE